MIQYLKEKEERVVQNFTVNFPFYAVSKTVCNCNLVFFYRPHGVFTLNRELLLFTCCLYLESAIVTLWLWVKQKIFLFIIANLYFVSMAFVFNKYLGVFFSSHTFTLKG